MRPVERLPMSLSRVRNVVMMLAATSMLAMMPQVANAHPVHSTLAVVAVDASGITIRLRAFADDFSTAVAKFAGKRAPSDSSASTDDIARYAAARFDVTAG